MNRIVFFVEEPSMARFLDGLVPRLIPAVPFVCVEHEGKHELESRLEARLRGWRVPGDRIVVVRDQDAEDCKVVKRRLAAMCRRAGRPDAVVRVACRELEAWYLGDLPALAAAYGNPGVARSGRRRSFRDPDAIPRPASVLASVAPGFRKVDGARRMGVRLDGSRNSSRSFRVFVAGIQRLAAGMSADEEE